MIVKTLPVRISSEQLELTNIKDVIWDILLQKAGLDSLLAFSSSRFVQKSTYYDEENDIWVAQITWYEPEETELWKK